MDYFYISLWRSIYLSNVTLGDRSLRTRILRLLKTLKVTATISKNLITLSKKQRIHQSKILNMDISYNQLIAQISNLYKCRTSQHLQYDVSL